MKSKRATKYCPQCEQDLAAALFARMDMNAICRQCQRSGETFTSTTPGGAAQPAIVRRGLNRRIAPRVNRND